MITTTARRAAIALINGYQRFISPLLPRACRYYPSCSEYVALAIGRYGLLKGAGLAFMRLARCHPFARGGHDPIP
jgi:putative membrane protein insertion efficiency factor